MPWREMQSRKQEEENRRGSKGLFVFLNYLLREEIYLRLSFASFLWSPTHSKRKKRSHANFRLAWLLLLFRRIFFHFRYSTYSFVRKYVKSPRVVESIARKIYFIIGQSAVNAFTHHQSTILQDFLPCVFLTLRNHIKHSIEDVLCPYSVNFLLHNLKIQPLITYIPLALHWTVCGV